MRADMARGAAALATAVMVAALLECVPGLPWVVGHGVRSTVEYAAMGLTLAVLAGLGGALSMAVLAGMVHLGMRAGSGRDGWPGFFAAVSQPDGDGGAAPWVHSVGAGLALFIPGVAMTVTALVERFHQAALIGLVAAVVAVMWLAVAVFVAVLVAGRLRGARMLSSGRAEFDPLVSSRAAVVLWLVVAWVAALFALVMWSRLRMVFPGRVAASLTLVVLLMLEGPRLAGALCTTAGRPRRKPGLVALAALGVALATLLFAGDEHARRALLRSPVLALVVDGLSAVTDVDGDGYSSLLGQGDCAPWDSSIHPGARDIADDGVDQNCAGGDFTLAAERLVPDEPLPAALARGDYAVLLLTIDTLRYDRTGAGGHVRPVTPNLDALAARGAWFERFYSAGSLTKDVLPVLVAGQHMDALPQGKALGGPQLPRELAPEAVTLAEVLGRHGYATGMFTAQRYFDGWGVDQGMGEVVNLAAADDAAETAPELTRRAMSWIEALPAGVRWLAWVHYYEPHYPYELHESTPSFGTGESDRYDAEVRFVDEQLGVWRGWLDADPARAARTIVVVTSDHGEQLREHGDVGHGRALWEYLIHVPLLVVVPGAGARRVGMPASTIDIAPTVAGLVGVPRDESWAGASLVGAILGREHGERVVFAAEHHKRLYAAIAVGWKLIRDDYRNLYQLVDLTEDRGEESDASAAEPAVFRRLEEALIQWRERLATAQPDGQ